MKISQNISGTKGKIGNTHFSASSRTTYQSVSHAHPPRTAHLSAAFGGPCAWLCSSRVLFLFAISSNLKPNKSIQSGLKLDWHAARFNWSCEGWASYAAASISSGPSSINPKRPTGQHFNAAPTPRLRFSEPPSPHAVMRTKVSCAQEAL